MKLIHPLKNEVSDTLIETKKQKFGNNTFNYFFGLGLMVANKIRHEIQGYKSARGVADSKVNLVTQHNFNIVRRYIDYLEEYQIGASNMEGKNILELGPGADLGVGLITLAEGAKNYYSFDIHNLIKSTPQFIYDNLFDFMESLDYSKIELERLKTQLQKSQDGEMEHLRFQCQKNFNVSFFDGKKIDLVVSNAAFQQFDNPVKTIQQMNNVVSSGGFFISLIDLGTHTRFIKERDPLNLYRYAESIYNSLKFSGSPNRVRPLEYKKALEENGWTDVEIFPRVKLEKDYLAKVDTTLNSKFRNLENQMDCLTVVICATKK